MELWQRESRLRYDTVWLHTLVCELGDRRDLFDASYWRRLRKLLGPDGVAMTQIDFAAHGEDMVREVIGAVSTGFDGRVALLWPDQQTRADAQDTKSHNREEQPAAGRTPGQTVFVTAFGAETSWNAFLTSAVPQTLGRDWTELARGLGVSAAEGAAGTSDRNDPAKKIGWKVKLRGIAGVMVPF